MAETLRGRFVWNELMTTNVAGAADFYGKVVGWKAEPWKRNSAYLSLRGPSGPAAGLMLLPLDAKAAGATPSWMSYVGTPNVDGTVREAERLGGHCLRGVTAMAGVGSWAVLADPQGAVFAPFAPESQRRPSHPPGIGEISWHELATTDHRAALAFYGELFGWVETAVHDMGPLGEYMLFGFPGEPPLGGMWTKTKEMPFPPHWLSYVRVEDVKGAAARIGVAGGTLMNGPSEVPGGDWIAQGLDPQGAAFAIVQSAPGGARPEPAPAAPEREPAAPKVAARKPAARKAAARRPTARKASAPKAPSRKAAGRKPAGKKPAARKPMATRPAALKVAPRARPAPAGRKAKGGKGARKPAARKPSRRRR
jgi:hypothetical protein